MTTLQREILRFIVIIASAATLVAIIIVVLWAAWYDHRHLTSVDLIHQLSLGLGANFLPFSTSQESSSMWYQSWVSLHFVSIPRFMSLTFIFHF